MAIGHMVNDLTNRPATHAIRHIVLIATQFFKHFFQLLGKIGQNGHVFPRFMNAVGFSVLKLADGVAKTILIYHVVYLF